MTDQNERFDRMEAAMERMRLMNYMLEFRGEVSGRLQAMETQMRVLASSQQSFESKLPALTRATIESAEGIASYTNCKWSARAGLSSLRSACENSKRPSPNT